MYIGPLWGSKIPWNGWRIIRIVLLLHIKDRWIIGDSGMMNFPNIFKKAYEIGILGYYVELEGDKKGRTQFEGVEKSAAYLQAAPFVK